MNLRFIAVAQDVQADMPVKQDIRGPMPPSAWQSPQERIAPVGSIEVVKRDR